MPPGLSFASLSVGNLLWLGHRMCYSWKFIIERCQRAARCVGTQHPSGYGQAPPAPSLRAAGGCWGGMRMRLCSFTGDCFQQPGLFLSTITINKASERVFIFPLQIFSSSCFLPVHTADWGALQQGGPRSRLLLPPHHQSHPCSHSCSFSCSCFCSHSCSTLPIVAPCNPCPI